MQVDVVDCLYVENLLGSKKENIMHARFVAVSPGNWGTGSTIEEAKTALKEFGGKWTEYAVWELPPGAEGGHVNQMGGLSWFWSETADRSGTAVIVKSRGLKKV